MGQKSYIHHFLVVGGGTALNMLVGFLTTPVITRLVGTEEYGQFSIFTMYATIALLVFCMGTDQSLIRFFYRKDTIDYQRTIIQKCWQLPVIVCVVVGIMVNFLCYTGRLHLEFDNYVVTMLTICVLFQVLNRLDLIVLRVSYKTILYSVLQVAYKTLFAILVLLGCWYFKAYYFYVMVTSMTASYIIVTCIGVYCQRDLWSFWKSTIKYDINLKELYTYAFPFIISMGITTIFQAIDKISLNMYCTYSEVGIYSSAMTLVHIFAIIQTTFNSLWAPMATEHYEKNPEDKEYHIRGNRVITVVMFIVGFSLIAIKDIFALLLGSDYREAAYILPFLIFNPIMYTVSETTVVGIVFMKKSNMHIVVASISCLVNILGNTILVPAYGCRGAAISTGIAYIVFFISRTLIANHYYHVDWRLSRFWSVTVIAVVYAWYNTFYQFSIVSVIGYIVAVGITLILYKDALIDVVKEAKQLLNKFALKRH